MNLTLMTYNVCHYNNDRGEHGFPPAIMDEKVSNLKELLMWYAPDLIGLQEDIEYIDRAGTIKTGGYLFAPVWNCIGTAGVTIRDRIESISTSRKLVEMSTGRFYRRCLYRTAYGNILFINAHPTPYSGAGNVAKRLAEYTEIFDYTRKAKYDICVVCGDLNTEEEADKANLKRLCETNGFAMVIGTYLPWVKTCFGYDGKSNLSYDNILVKGATIKRTQVLRDWYPLLYSDHVPVLAEISF